VRSNVAILASALLMSCGTSGGDAGTGTGGAGGMSGAWRSALYPVDWKPGFAKDGRRLADFSYAGYHRGEEPFGAPSAAATFEVADFGADASGASDATAAVQAAIAAAQKSGGIVHFGPGLFRIDGELTVTAAKVVLRGAGPDKTRLAFTKSAGMSFKSHLAFAGKITSSDEQPLVADGEPFSFTVKVADASPFKPGDDVAIGWMISDAFIAEHQMAGTWDHAGNAFAHKWMPFFLRQVVSVDVAAGTVTVDVPLRYPAKLRDQASIEKQTGYLSECGIESLAIGNAVAWDAAWAENQVHAVALSGVKDCWVNDVHSFAPPAAPTAGPGAGAHLQSGGILVANAKRVTVAKTELGAAEHRGGGGNGYVFEVLQSNEILSRDLVASAGRHNFIQNWGFGTTGCVWLRVHSSGGVAWLSKDQPGLTGSSEFHHSLALANLIDASTFDDGWAIVNRGSESSYAGHTGTQNAMWNLRGQGVLRSRQFGDGFVIGTRDITVQTSLAGVVLDGAGTQPEDYSEGLGTGATLAPQSLYEDQLAKRLAK
jgi:hypothetical protein